MDAQDGGDLRRAGSAAVEVNAPLGDARRRDLVSWLAEHQPAQAVDLGCGHGALLTDLVVASSPTSGLGVDLDLEAIQAARDRAAAARVDDRTTWNVEDARWWTGPCHAVIAVGVSHVFGGVPETMDRAAQLLTTGGVALLGVAVWTRRPDRWCRETFGSLSRPDDLVDRAEMEAWHVEDVQLSTVEEWDAFEAAWTRGVESVGTPEAATFAAERRQDYTRYRGVLGMAWLQIAR